MSQLTMFSTLQKRVKYAHIFCIQSILLLMIDKKEKHDFHNFENSLIFNVHNHAYLHTQNINKSMK